MTDFLFGFLMVAGALLWVLIGSWLHVRNGVPLESYDICGDKR